MQDMNVLTVFCSRTGRTEKLALAAAVGAVQARANIRLRWLREAADDRTIEGVAGWKENRERMAKEYIAPRTVDVEWADALIIAASGVTPELRDYLAALEILRTEGKLDGKVGATLGASLSAMLSQLGLTVVPDGSSPDTLENARLQGQRVTEVARALKAGTRG